ncbi:hypothetical protein [Alistipes sp.]|uniref:hypothetical protein n=1 Tax=Alistipes sp. TaxID=1872444 RepID=UPI0025C0BDA3|nr:hypothetical protein [Alistipes sp.]
MDDFASVIWTVIIVGAMIFNVVAQSRKARGKGARTPGHEEAWPAQEHPASEAAPPPVLRPVAPVFPDECQSLEEIPAEEYMPEQAMPKAVGTGHTGHSGHTGFLRHQSINSAMDDGGNDEIAAHSLTNNEQETATAFQAEEFNLRQAIIYSEILKPKFGEHL